MTEIVKTTWSEDRDWAQPAHEIVLVTPEIATRMIQRNGWTDTYRNRPYRPWRTRYFVELLQTGAFEQTGQGIVFLKNGRLGDGQHRVAAIRQSGVPAMLDVRYGVEPRAMHAMDLPLRRSPGDYLAMRGETDGNVLASSLKLLYRYLTGIKLGRSVNYEQLIALLDRHGRHEPGDTPEMDIRNYLTTARMSESRLLIPRSAALVAGYLTGEPPNPDDSEWFSGLFGSAPRYQFDPRGAMERQINKERKNHQNRQLDPGWIVTLYGNAYRAWKREQTVPDMNRQGVRALSVRAEGMYAPFGRVDELRKVELALIDEAHARQEAAE